MRRDSGFTLPETVVATAIVVTGLVGIAWIFSTSVATNLMNRHRSSAAVVASAKLEEFKSTLRSDSRWSIGGGLDPRSPIPGYFDRVTAANATYLRLWQVRGSSPRAVDVVVYAESAELPGQRLSGELIRLSMTHAPGF
jgi:Tfp pilus assembly protein PilV